MKVIYRVWSLTLRDEGAVIQVDSLSLGVKRVRLRLEIIQAVGNLLGVHVRSMRGGCCFRRSISQVIQFRERVSLS